MNAASARVIGLIADPNDIDQLNLDDWSKIISIARGANLLGLLCERLRQTGASIPSQVQRHLDGAALLSQRQRESVRWEAHQLAAALKPLNNTPVLVLKGAAYVLGNLPNRTGRLFGDIDILAPKAMLSDVEMTLMTHGWVSYKQSEYDQRYYRKWMHELPPMVHIRRGTVLDVHHALLPITCRQKPDSQKIIDASSEIPGLSPLRLPCPQDLLLHSITHLFHEGELHNGLRDLFDIDGLVRHFADTIPDFWSTLLARAEELQLTKQLILGAHFSHKLLGTPIPVAALDELRERDGNRPVVSWILDALYSDALLPMHPECDSSITAFARLIIYVRAHWLRMPPHLLGMHLSRKAWKSLFPDKPRTLAATENARR